MKNVVAQVYYLGRRFSSSWATIFIVKNVVAQIYYLGRRFLKKQGDDFKNRRPRVSWPTIFTKQADDFYRIVAQERQYKRQKFGNPNHFFSRQAYSLSLSENPLSALSLSLSPTPTPTPIRNPDPDVDPQFKV